MIHSCEGNSADVVLHDKLEVFVENKDVKDTIKIGRGGPVNWPVRSHDLSCQNFLLWGHMKSLVYRSPVDSDEALVAWIAVVAGDIQEMPEVFANARQSLRRRFPKTQPYVNRRMVEFGKMPGYREWYLKKIHMYVFSSEDIALRRSLRGLPCHEFEPTTTKDPPCRAAMHVKSVES
ncbi:uncharacterized protein TNCV_3291271 [Trichonephila clavipes]|nr:uncharacterized protein TNCV_3291271 [Trichonephila clavipes]